MPAFPSLRTHSSPGAVKRTGRVAGIDVARGVASLIMLQGHATDGWVPPAHQDGAFALSRLLGTLPLPAFLLLAGASVTWRLHLAVERGESLQRLRTGLLRRGFQLLLIGYAASGAMALVDGADGWSTVLRADVLHVIGLSIALAALLLAPPPRFVRRVIITSLALTLLCPLLPALTVEETGLLGGTALGLFVDVAPITRMPLVPLFAWFGAGVVAASWMRRGDAREDAYAALVGTTRWRVGLLAILGIATVAIAYPAMHFLHEAFGGALNRQHPAILANVFDLAGRGLLVLAFSLWLTPHLSPRIRIMLVHLGRGSLTAYLFHLPFCYGRLASPMRGATMGQAAVGIIVLAVASYGVVRLHQRIKRRAQS